MSLHAPVTGKARRPVAVESLTAGTDRLSVVLVEDRSLWRDGILYERRWRHQYRYVSLPLLP